MGSRAIAHVDLAAIERNCARLCAHVGSDVALCAVVKADGYGHGAVQAARAAHAGGASWLAVATASEAKELRRAGVAGRLLVLGALDEDELAVALQAGGDVIAWSEPFVKQLRALVALRGEGREAGRFAHPARVHLKLDVGMARLGTRDADELLRVAALVQAAPELELVGAMTHFPCADDDLDATRRQLQTFLDFADRLRLLAPGVLLHAANSAAALALPEARLDLVRCGIGVYGMDPWGGDPAAHGLEPALALHTWVAVLERLEPGDTVGYGATFAATDPTWIATLPIGYGDGFRRAFSNNGAVLIGGRRHPLVGRVSMDNLCVDLGPDLGAIAVGDRAVLLGADGGERITAEELAARIGTINYEITTGLTARVGREHHSDGRRA